MLLWLWCRPAAVAPIQPLAWEPPYASGMALKRQKGPKTKKNTSPPPVLFCIDYGKVREVEPNMVKTILKTEVIENQAK